MATSKTQLDLIVGVVRTDGTLVQKYVYSVFGSYIRIKPHNRISGYRLFAGSRGYFSIRNAISLSELELSLSEIEGLYESKDGIYFLLSSGGILSVPWRDLVQPAPDELMAIGIRPIPNPTEGAPVATLKFMLTKCGVTRLMMIWLAGLLILRMLHYGPNATSANVFRSDLLAILDPHSSVHGVRAHGPELWTLSAITLLALFVPVIQVRKTWKQITRLNQLLYFPVDLVITIAFGLFGVIDLYFIQILS